MIPMDSSAWKEIALRSICFGAGFAVALSLIAGGFHWLSERPKRRHQVHIYCARSFFMILLRRLVEDNF